MTSKSKIICKIQHYKAGVGTPPHAAIFQILIYEHIVHFFIKKCKKYNREFKFI